MLADIQQQYFNLKIHQPRLPTIVTFSARNEKPYNFSYFKSKSEDDLINRIMLNCRQNTWYLSGIEDFSDDFDSTLQKLKQLLAQYSSNSLFIGSSMGGYGALLYGSLCKAERIICFATEIITNLPGGFSSGNLAHLDKDSGFYCLEKYIKNTSSKIDLITGEFNPTDLYCAFSVKDYGNVKIHVIKNTAHAVVQSLKAQDLLPGIVDNGVRNEDLEIDKSLYLQGKLLDFLKNYRYRPDPANFTEFVDKFIKLSLSENTTPEYYELILEYLIKARFFNLADNVIRESELHHGKLPKIQINSVRLLYKRSKYLEVLNVKDMAENEELIYLKSLSAKRLNDETMFNDYARQGIDVSNKNNNKAFRKVFEKLLKAQPA